MLRPPANANEAETVPVKTIEQLPVATNEELSIGRQNLSRWLGKTFRVVITDGRVLVGYFNCADKDANLVLSLCAEYLEEGKDARMLGNVMVPGKHIVSIAVDLPAEEAFSHK